MGECEFFETIFGRGAFERGMKLYRGNGVHRDAGRILEQSDVDRAIDFRRSVRFCPVSS